jgi:predicted ATPase/class 3 adenylate cyclase/Tfp pilus assembly protein PilF
MQASPGVVTFLFTDIEGSSLLWEREPERMPAALARHDALARAAVEEHRGRVVKMLGDGVHAVFDDPCDAVMAAIAMQRALAGPAATNGVAFSVRCGLHAGVEEQRDNDFFGRAVNRAARIMGVAHGGQILLSQMVGGLVAERLSEDVALRDLGLVRLRDLANPERVCQVLHPALRAEFPPLRTLEATPNNLPQQLTSFIGREREQDEVASLLARSPLLTLLGAGGIGKTRLSLQVAANVMDDFSDGVWLVELAALTDDRLVAQAVASVLKVKEEAGRPIVEALVKYVKDRQLLVLLDNCEHLLQGCADLAKQLLQSGARMKILASSREPLRVAGETTYPVPALAFPGLSRLVTPAALEGYEAVQLFIDRAVAAQSTFRVTEQNAAALAGVCHHLDGIPLAIELAAARTRALSLENIAARLDDRFQLLKGGDKTALPRQQTLRALIDWSFDLLAEPERVLLRRLAVFSGGFTVEAAEAVCSAGDLGGMDVLEALTNLVEKSLVSLEAEGERYRLLETVRQYALERLDESGEADGTRTRHLKFFAALAHRARPEHIGPQQGRWLDRIATESENLLSAHAWCDRAEDGAALGLQLVHDVKFYLHNRGFTGLAHRMTLEALARPGAQRRDAARSRGCFDAGQACCFMGRYAEAQALLEEGLSIAREMGDVQRIGALLQPLGITALGQGNRSAARGYFEEALVLARKEGDRREIAAALNNLAQFHRAVGALDTAEPLYEQVLTLARELGDTDSIAIALLNLAMVSIARDARENAREALLGALAVALETGSKPVGQSVLEVSAGLAAADGEWERAALLFGAAESQHALTGLSRDPADEAFLAPLIAKAREALGAAAFNSAESGGGTLSWDDAIAAARAFLEAREPAAATAPSLRR